MAFKIRMGLPEMQAVWIDLSTRKQQRLLQTEAEKNDYGSRLKLYQVKVPYHRAKD
jgi:hypothetical protein